MASLLLVRISNSFFDFVVRLKSLEIETSSTMTRMMSLTSVGHVSFHSSADRAVEYVLQV